MPNHENVEDNVSVIVEKVDFDSDDDDDEKEIAFDGSAAV
jgi:hypothetical protein